MVHCSYSGSHGNASVAGTPSWLLGSQLQGRRLQAACSAGEEPNSSSTVAAALPSALPSCAVCGPPEADGCKYDVSDCSGLEPGGTCAVRCKAPYFGAASVGRCPADNTRPSQAVVFAPQACAYTCPDPASVPAGYARDAAGGWACAAGYTGAAELMCSMDTSCRVSSWLVGCVALAPCVAPVVDPADVCEVDISACSSVSAGSSCEVSCRSPHVGGPATAARCPADNTDPQQPVHWTKPNCTFVCPESFPVPAGYDYNFTTGSVQCGGGYFGKAEFACGLTSACDPSFVFTGCLPPAPCRFPPLEGCAYDASECASGVAAGGSCSVRCRAPHVGSPTTAACPHNNTNASSLPSWTLPSCELRCPDPPIAAIGYVKDAGGWQCEEGYVGAAAVECSLDPDCSVNAASVRLTGCRELMPCWAPDVEACKFDTSDCRAVAPGGSCQVRCRPPYFGVAAAGRCAAGNTDPWRELQLALPQCTLNCPEPALVAEGYVRTSQGWSCDVGYTGTANTSCVLEWDCATRSEHVGCEKLVPCAAPELGYADDCQYDLSECPSSLAPGASCRVRCKSSYISNSTFMSCSSTNTDPGGVIWEPPRCEPICPRPLVVPESYMPIANTANDWQCTSGYAGNAQVDCPLSTGCNLVSSLRGCEPLMPCAALRADTCEYDVSDCGSVQAGGSCEVRCKVPYLGTPGTASCPAGNLDPEAPLHLAAPSCSFACPPPQWRVGYDWNPEGWHCAAGYAGTAEISCSLRPDCTITTPELSGCRKQMTCVAPEVDPCRYDISGCVDLMAGLTCQMQCRPPFVGNYTVAGCHANNTVPGTPLEWQLPKCTCPDPLRVPPGYVKTASGWACEEGWLGTAVKRCNTTTSCLAEPQLSGCARLVHCASLQVDTCEFSTLDCASVAPGESCELPCRYPYVGGSTFPRCPAGNVDPLRQLTWAPPSCSLNCPLGVGPPPRGYERTPDGSSWQCAQGYGGRIEVINPPLTSITKPDLTGCRPRQLTTCTAPELDSCRFDVAECSGIEPGSSCNIHCRRPFLGDATLANCVDGRPALPHQLQWSLPQCHRECVDLLPVATGYIKTATGWSCAEGYVGTPVAHCRLGRSCEDLPPALTGCERIEPCLPPQLDVCKFDISDCLPSVQPGSSCLIRCKPPFNVTSTVATCAWNNTDPRKVVDWTPPSCALVDCLDPSPVPAGYVKTLGGWRCAPGFGGEIVGCCRISDACTPRIRLAGCRPLEVCAMPDEDACQYNIDCASTLLGSGCDVSCRPPYRGSPTVANCTGPGSPGVAVLAWPPSLCNCTSLGPECPASWVPPQRLNYGLPRCECPDPPLPQPGYTKEGGAWECAPGYHGRAEKRCQHPDACISQSELVGCLPIVPCGPMDVDVCMLNISNCTGANSGESCMVHCRSPYHGRSMAAKCPANNTDPRQAAVFLEGLINCTLECPDPSIVPEGYFYMGPPQGYVITPYGWQCAAGYSGTVVFNCTFDEQCDPNPEAIGCELVVPCASPTVTLEEGCEFDASNCSALAAGGACEVRCKPPFFGAPAAGHCRVNNTDPAEEVQWARPACSCPETCFAKEGYDKVGGRWQCKEGYTGTAVTRCKRPTECLAEPEVSGCDLVVPCVAPVVGAAAIEAALPAPGDEATSWCSAEVASCAGTASGSVCSVQCKAPYTGEAVNASCPINNTNPAQAVDWTLPDCAMEDCPDVDPIPVGYEKTAGGWRCAENYIGEVELTCGVGAGSCRVGTQPVGCVELMPCQVPDLDPCVYDLSNCTSFAAGVECELRCAAPYEGTPTVASCVENNTDPLTLLNFSLPECVSLTCPDPSPIPRGYARTPSGWGCAEGFFGTVAIFCNQTTGRSESDGEAVCHWQPAELSGCLPLPFCRGCPDPKPVPDGYVKVGESFQCAEGYLGQAVEHCESCSEEGKLAGCAPAVPCVPPEADPCGFDVSECWALEPGHTCTVRVRRPYLGPSTTASCPWNNTDPGRGAEWSLPEVECPDPTIVPLGYVRDGSSWRCADGYGGSAVTRCQRGTRCIGASELTGCLPLAPCPGPVIDECQFEMQYCPVIFPRYYCPVKCRAPYVGPVQRATCPADNTDPDRVADWDPAPCHLQCPDPNPIPAGYVKTAGGWDCASGYIGNATHSCAQRGSGTSCTIDVFLTGCSQLVPCAALTADPCVFNATACSGVQGGSTCSVHCKAPYVGNSTLGSCPGNNTNLSTPLSVSLPACALQCPDPEPSAVPDGYVKQAGRWQCAADYTGDVLHNCSVGGACAVDVDLGGCTRMLPCVVPGEYDRCKFNMTDCIGTRPGSSCAVTCSDSFAGSPSDGLCPADNTDPAQPIVWSPPQCTLVCPEPPLLPGYVKQGSAWQCASGHIGSAAVVCDIDTNCTVTSALTGCTPQAHCLIPAVDPCVLPLDFSDCNDTFAGSTCEVRCLEPYVGSPTAASCPATNDNPVLALQFPPPSCRCPGPNFVPLGYVNNASGWFCADGYVGRPNITCRNATDCTAEPQVVGCLRIQPCAAPPLDPCVYDLSACSSVQPGATCLLQCASSFVRNASNATCPADNTDAGGGLQYSAPLCACTEPPAATGYARTAVGWACAPGYLGAPSVVCPVANSTTCEVSTTLVGCDRIVSCGPMPDKCDQETSPCASVAPGGFCEVACSAPFLGDPVNVTCPAGNVDPTQAPLWDVDGPPNCGVSLCPDPDPAPPEYEKNGFAWQCTSGYAGRVSITCPLNATCYTQTELTGCLPVQPCARPVLDTCRYNTTACASVPAGGYCVVRCVGPYVGQPVGAACRGDNVDPNGRLVLPVLPDCQLDCPDPYPMPAGYIRANGALQCTPDYVGTVSVECARTNEGCGVATTLSGCTLRRDCIVPDLDPCVFNLTCAGTLPWGSTCQISCRPPYLGSPAVASCPADNTVADLDMIPGPQPVPCYCPDPCPIPPGYVRAPGGGWQCDAGYVGLAEKRCSYQRTCYAEPRLVGCVKIVPCAPLPAEACDLDTSNCSRVDAGHACEVRCREPYRGTPTVATCPVDNVDPGQMVTWSSPVCELPGCADDHDVPVGYVKSSSGWRCAEGYAGVVEKHCTIDGTCKVGQVPTGCLPLQPCVDPEVDTCVYDVSACSGIHAGSSCEVRCRAPFRGRSGFGGCPADNVNASYGLELSLPECECPDPGIIPAGYVKRDGEWRCASGYAGSAVKRCRCLPQPELQGCALLVPCVIPAEDMCQYDFSNCSSVQPGTSCEVTCRPPYQEGSTTAICPVGNTDPFKELQWAPPLTCVIEWGDCNDPLPVPEGYEKTNSSAASGWQCSEGYAGDVRVPCGPWENCRLDHRPVGCKPLAPCVAPDVDDCTFEASECDGLPAGSQCRLRCKSPFVGNASVYTCPADNTDPTQVALGSAPRCSCPDPAVVPAGYARNASGFWSCADGYVGTPEKLCRRAAYCLEEPEVVGCVPAVPCAAPTVDPCKYDASDCFGMQPNSSCTIRCKAPYTGAPTIATCPLSSADGQELRWEPPQCGLSDCPAPTPLPAGYARTAENSSDWYCSDGYSGTAMAHCSHDAACNAYLSLYGCVRAVIVAAVHCALPTTLDACKYDLSKCSNTLPGASCQVHCKAPFIGEPTSAACPAAWGADGAVPTLSWSLPHCNLEDCPDPVPVPAGFRKAAAGDWSCAVGHNGSVVSYCSFDAACRAELVLSGCSPAVAGDGGIAAICIAPKECGDPAVVPAGYVKVDEEWQCADGYEGTAMKQCMPIMQCAGEPLLRGCVELQPCASLAVDSCEFDVSACTRVEAGSSCEISCKSPYTGNSTFGRCPDGNVDPRRPLAWTRPNCSLIACPERSPVPVGYVKTIDGWQCAEGFTGSPTVACNLLGSCEVNCTASGCAPYALCVVPPVDPCEVNVSDCQAVAPGGSCEVRCSWPYEGNATTASCPVNPLGPVVGEVLQLTLPECSCGDPAVEPPGYARAGEAWECAEGFRGAVEKRCRLGPEPEGCLREPLLSGCVPLVPCRAPDVDPCQFNVSQCLAAEPGESCEVQCREPYYGNSSMLFCPGDNTNLSAVPEGNLPECSLECPDPPDAAPGYLKLRGRWTCAEGYRGDARVACTFDQRCETSSRFVGCVRVPVPCVAPRLSEYDACIFNVTDCEGVAPGTSCIVSCQATHLGTTTAAHCPADNFDPEAPPQWTPPKCKLTNRRAREALVQEFGWITDASGGLLDVLVDSWLRLPLEEDCDDPSPIPAGYVKNATGWFCAPGYLGKPVTRCGTKPPACDVVLELSGCAKLVPCVSPVVDNCTVDVSDCWGVKPGASCHLRCRRHCSGQPTLATCPGDNTDPNYVLAWSPPNCTCRDESPALLGYASSSAGWQCAEGFTGQVAPRCRHRLEEVPFPELFGCMPLKPCMGAMEESCLYNTSDCAVVNAGSTCNVRCKPPRYGVPAPFSCPANNTDTSQAPQGSPPQCDLRCSAPEPLPAGYASRGGENWTCAEGYSGTVRLSCSMDERCEVTTTLSGCLPLVPCALPAVDECKHDLSNCTVTMPGASCRITCKAPFVGAETAASCPEGNTNSSRVLQWSAPSCVLPDCPDPVPLPVAYAKSWDGVTYVCAAGYVGRAFKVCGYNATCSLETSFVGCLRIRNCMAPDVDSCRYDVSDCTGLAPWQECEIRCRAPYVGNATKASCPRFNGLADGLLYELPICFLPPGVDLLPVPRGYMRTADGWRCAPGYDGALATQCTRASGQDCRTHIAPAGCSMLVPCDVGGFVDVDTRSGVLTGNLTFGPAQLSDGIKEVNVRNYQVFFVDKCNQTLGAPLDTVVKGATDLACCKAGAYTAELVSEQVPVGAEGLVVLASTSSLTSAIGVVLRFEDLLPPTPAPLPPPAPASAHRASFRGACLAAAAVAAARQLR